MHPWCHFCQPVPVPMARSVAKEAKTRPVHSLLVSAAQYAIRDRRYPEEKVRRMGQCDADPGVHASAYVGKGLLPFLGKPLCIGQLRVLPSQPMSPSTEHTRGIKYLLCSRQVCGYRIPCIWISLSLEMRGGGSKNTS